MLGNKIGRAAEQEEGGGLEQAANTCSFVRQRRSHDASQSHRWQNTLHSRKWIQESEKKTLA